MIFDENGLPKPTGADDWQDSAAVAGIMETFDHPKNIDLTQYIVSNKYVRYPHPDKQIFDFSRDQALCLMAGLWSQKKYHLVDLRLVDGKDWFTHGHKGHIKRCKNEKASWLQDFWLMCELLYHAKFTPLAEPNQLLCMAMVAGPEYVKLWMRSNSKWKESIEIYWSKWRAEPELASLMISKVINVQFRMTRL